MYSHMNIAYALKFAQLKTRSFLNVLSPLFGKTFNQTKGISIKYK